MTMLPSRSARPECAPPPQLTRSVSPVLTGALVSFGTPRPLGDEPGRSHGLVALALRAGANDQLYHTLEA